MSSKVELHSPNLVAIHATDWEKPPTPIAFDRSKSKSVSNRTTMSPEDNEREILSKSNALSEQTTAGNNVYVSVMSDPLTIRERSYDRRFG